MSLYNYISSAIPICCLSIFSIVQSFSFSIRMKSSHLLYISFFISLYILYVIGIILTTFLPGCGFLSFVLSLMCMMFFSYMFILIYKKKRHSRLLLARHAFSFLKETIANPGKGVNNFLISHSHLHSHKEYQSPHLSMYKCYPYIQILFPSLHSLALFLKHFPMSILI